MVGRHEVDEAQRDAYVWSVQADKLLAQGRLEDARHAMAEASARDHAYSVRAELIGQDDHRRIQVSVTVRRTVVPFLAAAGFTVNGGQTWTEGRSLSRVRGPAHDDLLIGRDKFGHRLGVTAAQWRDPDKVEYFDWRAIGIRSGALAYTTQLELESVCARWCALIGEHVLPWFDHERGSRTVKRDPFPSRDSTSTRPP